MAIRKWHTTEVKDNDLEDRLNSLQSQSYTIFSVVKSGRGGFSEYFMIVYYE